MSSRASRACACARLCARVLRVCACACRACVRACVLRLRARVPVPVPVPVVLTPKTHKNKNRKKLAFINPCHYCTYAIFAQKNQKPFGTCVFVFNILAVAIRQQKQRSQNLQYYPITQRYHIPCGYILYTERVVKWQMVTVTWLLILRAKRPQ